MPGEAAASSPQAGITAASHMPKKVIDAQRHRQTIHEYGNVADLPPGFGIDRQPRSC
jgi:hypothetical protein